MARVGATLLACGFFGTATFAVIAAGADPDPPATTITVTATVVDHRGAHTWQRRYRQRDRQLRHRNRQLLETRARLRRERRVLLSDPTVAEAINLACAVYGYCSTLWRKANCETGGTFNPRAANQSGASGLFQFLPSTWASTPFARFSIWSPYANALAAGWMHDAGRGGEWSCR